MLKFLSLSLSLLFVTSIASADPLRGDITDRDVLFPGGEITYKIAVEGGRAMTRFKVEGDGDSDIDCFVYDSDGDLVERDITSSSSCSIDVQPRYISTYIIKVRNVGDDVSAYTFWAF